MFCISERQQASGIGVARPRFEGEGLASVHHRCPLELGQTNPPSTASDPCPLERCEVPSSDPLGNVQRMRGVEVRSGEARRLGGLDLHNVFVHQVHIIIEKCTIKCRIKPCISHGLMSFTGLPSLVFGLEAWAVHNTTVNLCVKSCLHLQRCLLDVL